MLVLSRKKGESVVVNGNITIVVVDVRGDKARIGIEAPADVAVYRSEVLTKKAASGEGETEAEKKPRETKKGVAAKKRSKPRRFGDARKKSSEPSGESAVETLYLSSEAEAYRGSDAESDACETFGLRNDVR